MAEGSPPSSMGQGTETRAGGCQRLCRAPGFSPCSSGLAQEGTAGTVELSGFRVPRKGVTMGILKEFLSPAAAAQIGQAAWLRVGSMPEPWVRGSVDPWPGASVLWL